MQEPSINIHHRPKVSGDSEMKRIAWLPGDGIGKDVLQVTGFVLKATGFEAEYITGDVGWEFWKKEANPLPDRTIKVLKSTDCCMFGATTSKSAVEARKELEIKVPRWVRYKSPIVKIRQMMRLYANLRPCKAFPGNPLNYREDIDLVIFRENTEGLYSGVGFYPTDEKVLDALGMSGYSPNETAIDVRVFTRRGCQRILRAAFEHAKEYNREKVTVVEKPNVIRNTSGMMIGEARKIAEEYPDISLETVNVDAMTMWLIKNPERFDVLVTSNMFGDIISDLAGQLVGGSGFTPSGSYGDDYALFEPVHGSAPKYAGCFIVNPIAALLSAAMMLDYLDEPTTADNLRRGIEEVVREGKVRTYDMHGMSSESFNYKNPEEVPPKIASTIDVGIEIIVKMGLEEELKDLNLERYKDYIRVTKEYF